MNNNPPRTNYRKRSRQVQFDLNRSSPHVVHKLHKPNTPQVNSKSDKNREMDEGNKNTEQIRDLSQTIITGTSQAHQGAIHSEIVAQGSSKQSIRTKGQENLEDNIKKFIDQGVNSQVADIKRAVADLAETVGNLGIIVRQTQQENQKLLEANLQDELKTANDSRHPIDMSGVQTQSAPNSNSSSGFGDENKHYNRLTIDKWGLEFDGNSSKLAVEDFVFRLERLQSRYGVSWTEVLDNFHLLVKGAAEKWYWLFIQTNYVSGWPTLKSALLKQYQATRSSFELMRDMVERKQMPGESIDDFFFTMTQFRSRLSISMPESEMIKMIKKNLRENFGSIVYPMNVSSVEELRISCLDAEKTFLRREVRHQQTVVNRYPRQVNELYEEQDCQPSMDVNCEEVAAVRVSGNNSSVPKAPIICWNCRQNGHLFMDCPAEQRTIFCFRCGKADVIAPNCESCRNRNFLRNEGRAGDHRSKTNPQNYQQEETT